MILESTPYHAVIKTMKDENAKYMFFVEKESMKIKKMRYHDRFTYYSIYTHPISKNTYMFWCGKIVTKTWFLKSGNHNMRSGACLMVNTSDGGRMVYCLAKKSDGGRIVDAMTVYTSHFFKRYRERCLKDDSMPTNDVISTFFVRNPELIPLDYKQVVRKWEKYKDCAALQVNDGIVMGTEKRYNVDGHEFYVVENNTIISDTLLKDDQSDAMFTEEKMNDIIADYAKELMRKAEVLGEIS